MRRLVIGLTAGALLGAGLFIPARANPDTGPTDAFTGGTATIVVGVDPIYGMTQWTTTVSGQISVGGRTYSGTASGAAVEAYSPGAPTGWSMSFAGTSSTGSLNATCFGQAVQDEPQGLGVAVPVSAPGGALDENCRVSIDGAPAADLGIVFVMAPTADPNTYQGAFAAVPDITGLPTVPVVSLGTADASLSDFGGGSPILGFGFTGQISFGTQTFHGRASGGFVLSSGTLVSIDVPPFTLSGTSPTGSLNATCSGEFVDPSAVAVSVLSCNGSVNGGPPESAVLIGAYRITGNFTHAGSFTDYGGAFVGV